MSNRQLYAVLSVCKHLEQSGSAPTVGLVKSKLKSHVALPEIIKGIKYFQSDPKGSDKILEDKPLSKPAQTMSVNEEIKSMKSRISLLEQTIKDLQTEVTALKRQ